VIESGNIPSLRDKNETVGKTLKNMKKSNGELPEDIPSAKNDDALAAQIRYAAENETDPIKRKQLWNEYRKYKGLPTK
jgi:tRNA splicing ligase